MDQKECKIAFIAIINKNVYLILLINYLELTYHHEKLLD